MPKAKKFGAVALGLVLLLSGVFSAYAESEQNKLDVEKKAKIDIRVPMTVAKDLKEADERPQIHVNAGGKVMLQGAMVTAISADSISVSIAFGEYKSAWVVKLTDKTEVHRRKGGRTVLSEIAVGDTVSVTGAIDPNATSATVTAHVVKNWSATASQMEEKLIQGKLKSIDGMTYVVTVKDKDYTVKVSATTSVLNVFWLKTDLSNVKVGDTVRIYGMAGPTEIEAMVLRDVSLR